MVEETKSDRTFDGLMPLESVIDKTPTRRSPYWRAVGVGILAVTSACWITAASLTYGIAFHGVSPYWLPVAAVAGFSGEICLVIGLSLLGFKQFANRFEALKSMARRWLPPRS